MNYYIGNISYSDELYHHGIKGQKWGVRRFQNENGTFTSLGRQRHADAVADYKSAKEKKRAARRARRSGEISKEEYAKSKQELKNARLKVKSAKADIASYKLADKGKKLADKGDSLAKVKKEKEFGNKKALAAMGASTGAIVASNIMARSGRISVKQFLGVSAAAATGIAVANSINSNRNKSRSIRSEALKAYKAAKKGDVSSVTKSIQSRQRKKIAINVAVGAAIAHHVISHRDTYRKLAAGIKIGMETSKWAKNGGYAKRVVDSTARVIS